MLIRPETEADIDQVYALNKQAFDGPDEANLVNALREKVSGVISLVASEGNKVVGHIMFSPVVIEGVSNLKLYGLAPMAVEPGHQRKGIGSQLLSAGLKECRANDVSAVFVLGHPRYYPRFGFIASSQFDIRCEYDVPEEVFMALELQAGCLGNVNGVVKYNEIFDKV